MNLFSIIVVLLVSQLSEGCKMHKDCKAYKKKMLEEKMKEMQNKGTNDETFLGSIVVKTKPKVENSDGGVDQNTGLNGNTGNGVNIDGGVNGGGDEVKDDEVNGEKVNGGDNANDVNSLGESNLRKCQTLERKDQRDDRHCLCNKNTTCIEGSHCGLKRGSGFRENVCYAKIPTKVPNCKEVTIDKYARPVNPLCICGQHEVCMEGYYCYKFKKIPTCFKDFKNPDAIMNPKSLPLCNRELINKGNRCNCKDNGECLDATKCDLDGDLNSKCILDPSFKKCTTTNRRNCLCNDEFTCIAGTLCDPVGDYSFCVAELKLEKILEEESRLVPNKQTKRETRPAKELNQKINPSDQNINPIDQTENPKERPTRPE